MNIMKSLELQRIEAWPSAKGVFAFLLMCLCVVMLVLSFFNVNFLELLK